jgi:hypothetical protein
VRRVYVVEEHSFAGCGIMALFAIAIASYICWAIYTSIAHLIQPEIPAPRVDARTIAVVVARYHAFNRNCHYVVSVPVQYDSLGVDVPRRTAEANADQQGFGGLNVGYLRRIGDISLSFRYEPYERPIGWRATAQLTKRGWRDAHLSTADRRQIVFCDGMFVPKHVVWLRRYKTDTSPGSSDYSRGYNVEAVITSEYDPERWIVREVALGARDFRALVEQRRAAGERGIRYYFLSDARTGARVVRVQTLSGLAVP